MNWVKVRGSYINFAALSDVIVGGDRDEVRLFYIHVNPEGAWYVDFTGDEAKTIIAFLENHSC